MSIYLSSATLAVVVIVSVVLRENLTIYGATYAYGTALSTTTVLIIVFFTKVLFLVLLYQLQNVICMINCK